jgi:hypothetical protein
VKAAAVTTVIKMCNDANFKGACQSFTTPLTNQCFDLAVNGPEFNDHVSSVQVADGFAICTLFKSVLLGLVPFRLVRSDAMYTVMVGARELASRSLAEGQERIFRI